MLHFNTLSGQVRTVVEHLLCLIDNGTAAAAAITYATMAYSDADVINIWMYISS